MKTKLTMLICSLIIFMVCVSAQEITSGKKRVKIVSTPKLVIEKVLLLDENNNQLVEAGENCFYELNIKNTGVGVAKSVKVNTYVIKGSSPGLSFDESVYVGKILGGKQVKIKIPLSPGITVSEGTVRFKFEAYDANFYKSEPQYYDLKLKTKEKKINLAISWYYPIGVNTTVDKAKFTIKACIMTSNPLKEAKIYVNNIILANERGMILLKSTDCDYTLEKEIILNEGDNIIKLVVLNEGKTMEAPLRVITYNKKPLEHRLALVIGNSNYDFSPLKNPSNDAKSMAKALRELNFEVIEIIDGNKKKMREGVRKFGSQLEKNRGVGLFYYAGHGVQVKGENYLIPINSDIQKEYDIPDEAVRVNHVLAYMENSGSRMNIVVLDACRDNPFARSFRSGSRGLAQIYAEGSGSIIAYATSPGSVASDGDGKNGLYTQELLKAIKTPNLEIGMVFRKVLTNVKRISDGKQIPWTNASIEGEFYFIK
ncbi:MAG: caspase family protein [Bacteroidota bacterium]